MYVANPDGCFNEQKSTMSHYWSLKTGFPCYRRGVIPVILLQPLACVFAQAALITVSAINSLSDSFLPLAVYIDWGCSYHVAANIFLTSFAWVLGISHAWLMITAYSAISCKDYLMALMSEKKEVVIEQPKDFQRNLEVKPSQQPQVTIVSRPEMEGEGRKVNILP
ncbi:hypothetical protein OSTOST_07379 [Ostertagia ostertagi]